MAAAFDRVELGEEGQAVGDVAGVRRFDERERRHVAQADGGHLQDDRGQVGAQDLGIGELRPGLEVLLGVQPDADAVGDAPAAALPLVGRRLGDRLDRQPLDLRPVLYREIRAVPVSITYLMPGTVSEVSATLVAKTTRRAARGALEHPVLLGRRQPGVQREDVEPFAAAGVRGVADVALAAKKTRMSPGPSAASSSTASQIGPARGSPPSSPSRPAAGSGPPPGMSGRIPR